MDILFAALEKVRVRTQFKSILKIKDRSHSCAQLKTDHFSGSTKYKIVQFEKIKWDAHCHPGVDINELREFEKPNNW